METCPEVIGMDVGVGVYVAALMTDGKKNLIGVDVAVGVTVGVAVGVTVGVAVGEAVDVGVGGAVPNFWMR